MSLAFTVSSKSVPGSTHVHEDRILVDRESDLYAVADGVTLSSQGSGGAAAELALSLLKEQFTGDLTEAVEAVHDRLFELKRSDRTIGETTLTCAHLAEGRAEIVNVGDSPAYLVRGEEMKVMTHPDRNELGYITQVIGYPENIKANRNSESLEAGDFLILASDGIAHVLNHLTLLPILETTRTIGDVAEAIIEKAKVTWAGYDDDKSVIVIKATGAD